MPQQSRLISERNEGNSKNYGFPFAKTSSSDIAKAREFLTALPTVLRIGPL